MDKVANVFSARVFSLHGHMRPVTKIRYTPDGDYIISSSTDGYTRMWSSTDGKFIQSFGPLNTEGKVGMISHDQGVAVADFSVSSDGAYIVVAYLLDFITLYKANEMNKFIKTYNFNAIRGYSAIQHTRDGSRIVVGGKKILNQSAGLMVITVRDDEELECTKVKHFPTDVTCVALSPLEDYIMVGFEDGKVQLFDLETLEPYAKMNEPIIIGNGPIMNIQLYNDAIFTICCSDRKIVLFGAKTLTVVKRISTEYPVHCCTIHPTISNLMVYAGGMDTKIVTQTTHIENTFKLFFIDIAQDVKLGGIQAHVGPVHGLMFSTNGEDLISCSEDSTCFVIKVGPELKSYTFLK